MTSQSKLRTILTNLIAKSEGTGTPAMAHLDGGLNIDVEVGADAFRLSIYRHLTWPSSIEWTTVVAHLPDAYRPTPSPYPVSIKSGDDYILARTWPVLKLL